MLKNLLRLFCETFLKSKKEWIQNTTFIQDKGNISLPWESFTDGKEVEYVAPENGLFQCVIRTRTPNQIWSYGTDGKIVSRIGTRTESFLTGTIPVKKGYRVVIDGDGPLLELWFSPSVGGK